METEQLKKVLAELLILAEDFKSVEDLEEKIPPFIAVLTAIARRNYPILHSISLLKNDNLSGDAILDLARRMFEDMISVEFMVIKDKEHMAIKFFRFSAVERWINLEYLKKLGVTADPEVEKDVITNFEGVKQDFMRGDKLANSWSMTGLEGMIEELVKDGVINEKQTADLLQGYVLGNRKNHLSSEDAQVFVFKSQRDTNLEGSLRVGLIIAIVSYIRILSKYAEEVGNAGMITKLDKLFSQLNVKIDEV